MGYNVLIVSLMSTIAVKKTAISFIERLRTSVKLICDILSLIGSFYRA